MAAPSLSLSLCSPQSPARL
uniref:Uncharacterized protein n=1 Tax=Arundo donax TaxID=35708 RepID=A0A0A9AAL0_ARUDO